MVAYFDLFDYPVTRDELYRYLPAKMQPAAFDRSLECLVKERLLYQEKNFYALHPHPFLFQRRMKGNALATQMLKRAHRVARFLYAFPFVRFVGISGSLSKQFAEENSDLDFFIITARNRLWMARTLLHLFKKLSYLRGRQHWYCMNYFIDEDHLEIAEKNIFTAMETVTLVPSAGSEMYKYFADENAWVATFFPNDSEDKEKRECKESNSWMKRLFESLLSLELFNPIEKILWKITRGRWLKKETKGALNRKGAPMSLITSPYFARPNPNLFQKKLLRSYQEKLKQVRMHLPVPEEINMLMK